MAQYSAEQAIKYLDRLEEQVGERMMYAARLNLCLFFMGEIPMATNMLKHCLSDYMKEHKLDPAKVAECTRKLGELHIALVED